MSANVTRKRNARTAFADEDCVHEPCKRPTIRNQAWPLSDQRPSSSIHPPERPESILSALAILHSGSKDEQKPESYKHKPLDAGGIRLLHLHAGHWDDPIHCSLVTDSIFALSSYEALSYTWGEPHPAQKILLSDEEPNGSFTKPRTSLATPNLYDALKNIRRPDRPLVLWVDALCIDQSNTAEKNQQVRWMSMIYSNAHRVLVWLGKESASTTWAVSNVHAILGLDTSCETEPMALALCMAWNQYLRSSWFERTWVLQELVFAKRTTFIRGRSQLDSQDLQIIVDLVFQHLLSRRDLRLDLAQSGAPSEKLDFGPLLLASNLFKLTNDSIERSADGLEIVGKKRSLFEMIKATSSLKATDARDRIIGLLAIVDQGDPSSPISVDYNLSLPQICGQMVECEIEVSQSLDILTTPWAPRVTESGSLDLETGGEVLVTWLAGKPSWICIAPSSFVQHLRICSSKAVSTIGPGFSGMIKPFAASKDYLPVVRFLSYVQPIPSVPQTRRSLSKLQDRRNETTAEAKNRNDPRATKKGVLVASGIEVGTITDVSMRMAGGIVPRDCLEMAGMSFSEGCEALQNKPAKMWERLWRVLVADRNNEGVKAPTSFGLAFFKLFKQILRLRCIDTEELLEMETDENALEFLSRVRDVTWDRRMFCSSVNHFEETLIGLVPREAQSGDHIVILFGSSVPIIIRPAKGIYVTIIGEAYVHGKMHGEAFYGLSDEALTERTREFQIV